MFYPAPASIIETPRLVLRPFGPADAQDLFSIRGDAQAMLFWDWPADATIGQTGKMAERFVRETEAGDALYWTARMPDGEFIGLFDLGALCSTSAELGFMIARHHWGRGLATEAARAMIEEARRLGLSRLNARIHAGNDASRRLLAKLAFQTAGPDRIVEVAPLRPILCSFFLLDLGGHERNAF